MEGQHTLEAWATSLATAARDEGESRATWDRDWQAQAFDLIASWSELGLEWDADDLRAALPPAPSTGAAGAAIANARRAGLIRATGFGVSRTPSRHGGLQRRWGPA